MARKYFVDEKNIINNQVIIDNEDARHIIKVMRKNIGDSINVNSYITKIESIQDGKVTCKIIEKLEVDISGNIKIDIYQALPKFDKFEYIIQKTVELGINKIVPVITNNTVVKIEKGKLQTKLERWNKISKEAAKQSGRTYIPLVESTVTFIEMLDKIKCYDIVIFAYEKEETKLKETLKSINKPDITSIAVIIGCEGGFTKEEAQILKDIDNVKSISLGKNILRAETAPIVLIANINYEFDN